ncbi:helix-turn-helix transcriptional regulator [Paenibacillus sp. J2TS4]|uniref:helix-turn-helix transcriptional regulator n=1 Tax=Paenibacillus sp. J2TS4 TaxID=2807194 RepID=UPI001B112EED|nr:AraC family transcriptional regulator [Paenibacillus sp. J2TS4]GIP31234.1 hypothetical protein J2TS4_04440 [Paenibacillus sp. J2TS4]
MTSKGCSENKGYGERHMRILDELSEHVMLRINSSMYTEHNSSWIEKRAHHDYDLWIVQSGTISIQMQGVTGIAQAGDLIFFSPHIPYMATTENGCSFYYCHFDFAVGNHSRVLDEFNLPCVISGSEIKDGLQWINHALDAYRAKEPMSAIRLKGCLTLLLTQIIQNSGKKAASLQQMTKPSPQESRKLDVLQPVFSYIHQHIHRPLAIRELAEIARMSEKYFITFFKKTVGITPGQYLHQHRMNRARDYLYQQKYTVKEIAGLLGYPDPYTFSKAFKKHYHVPPSKFI